jgi:hypothetical protein
LGGLRIDTRVRIKKLVVTYDLGKVSVTNCAGSPSCLKIYYKILYLSKTTFNSFALKYCLSEITCSNTASLDEFGLRVAFGLAASDQGCQIFLGITYQNGKNIPKRPQNIPNGYKIYQITVK